MYRKVPAEQSRLDFQKIFCSKIMINTLNETHLHKTLKKIYANKTERSVMEQPAEGYIADIIRPDGEIIEIQTGNLSSLLPKITKYLAAKRNVTVVYPLAAKKYIETKKRRLSCFQKKKSCFKKYLQYIQRADRPHLSSARSKV